MPNKKEIVDVINFNLKEAFISDINNYKFTAQDNLVAWFDLDSTLVDQSNNSSQIASLNYRRGTANDNSAAVISKEAFNTTNPSYPQYNNARFNQDNIPNSGLGTRRHAKIVYNSPASIAFGSGGGDSAFSVSIWAKVNPDILSTTHPGRLFEFGTGGAGYAYRANVDKDGNVQFSLKILGGAGTKFFTTTLSNFRTDFAGWNHYVFTYNGDESSTDVKIYVNGESKSVTATSAGTYTGMGAGGLDFFIGAHFNEQNQWNGFISQVAVFNAQISEENAKAIYEGTSIGSYQDKTSYYSGKLSNPAKDIVKTLDKKVKRVHDGGTKKATYSSGFNDDNTIDFVQRKLIGSIGVEEGTTSTPLVAANTYSNYGIEITSQYDSSFTSGQVRNTFKGDDDPFNEVEKFFLSQDFTNLRETSIDIIDQIGLEEDANRKDIIEIDVIPSENTTFGITQGVGSGAKNDLMVYWNEKLKRWEKLGGTVLSPTSEGALSTLVADGRIGFAPTEGLTVPSKKSNFSAAFKNFGLPVDNFGFPSHPKYHATGSQYIEMKNFISEPFVVEKVVYELDAKLYVDKNTSDVFLEDDNPTLYGKSGHLGSYFTFFILNQKENDKVTDFETTKIFNQDNSNESNAISQTNSLGDGMSTIESNRDLVTYMQVAVFSNDSEGGLTRGDFNSGESATEVEAHLGFLKEGYGRHLNISGSDFISSSDAFDSNKYSFSGKMILSGNVLDDIKHESMGFNFKIGSDKYAISDLGNKRDPKKIENILNPRRFECASIFDEKNRDISFKHSLYPDLSKTSIEGITTKTTYYSNKEKTGPYILLPTDKLIFGWQSPLSLNASELSATNASSQMTINTGTGRIKLYGSFLRNKKSYRKPGVFYDNAHITRDIKDNSHDQFQIATRNQQSGSYNATSLTGDIPSRVSSSRTGTGPLVNSSIHFVSLKDEKENIYDSYLPDINSFVKRSGIGGSLSDNKITGADPFNKFRLHKVNEQIYFPGEKRQKSTKTVFAGLTQEETRKVFFSKGYSGISDESLTDNIAGASSISYGMYSYNLSKNKACFNTRHFGHYADIIEQRKLYAFEKEGLVFYPVEKRFVRDGERIKPIESRSQNISIYSTSSFPFIEEGIPTGRIDDTSKVDSIVIFPELPTSDIFSK